jgi:hypothetical protein
MKKSVVLLIMIIFYVTGAFAQTMSKPTKPVAATQTMSTPATVTMTKTVKTPPPPPASTTQYILSSVKVNLFTGNDNKELPSVVNLNVYRILQSKTVPGTPDPDGGRLLYFGYVQGNSSAEFRVNSNTELTLDPVYPPGDDHYENVNGLTWIQQYGLRLRIDYLPNFLTDAWKIDHVTMTLEFKDIQGRPDPSMPMKTVVFQNCATLMTNNKMTLILDTDKFLMPIN